jgi:hypothetical protein
MKRIISEGFRKAGNLEQGMTCGGGRRGKEEAAGDALEIS